MNRERSEFEVAIVWNILTFRIGFEEGIHVAQQGE